MRIYRAKDYDEMSRKAANIIAAQMTLKPDSVLGLATGSTPIGTYRDSLQDTARATSISPGLRPQILMSTEDSPGKTTRATTISCMRIYSDT